MVGSFGCLHVDINILFLAQFNKVIVGVFLALPAVFFSVNSILFFFTNVFAWPVGRN